MEFLKAKRRVYGKKKLQFTQDLQMCEKINRVTLYSFTNKQKKTYLYMNPKKHEKGLKQQYKNIRPMYRLVKSVTMA